MERALWISELVYGTLTVLIAIAGIDLAGGASPIGTGAIVLVGAAATWVAHAYASVLGRRVAMGHPASAAQIRRALVHASPILLAAIPSVIALGGASLGWWSSGAARGFSNVAAIAVLAAAGWMAAQVARETLGEKVRSTLLTASIGLGIVAVELLIH